MKDRSVIEETTLDDLSALEAASSEEQTSPEGRAPP
jgi:hypothetical protein